MGHRLSLSQRATLLAWLATFAYPVSGNPLIADIILDQSSASTAILTTESDVVPGLTSIFIGTSSTADSQSTASIVIVTTESDITPGLTSVQISMTTTTDSEPTSVVAATDSSTTLEASTSTADNTGGSSSSSSLSTSDIVPGLTSIPVTTTSGVTSQGTTSSTASALSSSDNLSSFTESGTIVPGLSSIAITTSDVSSNSGDPAAAATSDPTPASDTATISAVSTVPSIPSGTGPLTTFSALPQSISTSTTSVVANTHDSSGHPILGPFPTCWFCPHDSTSIVLLDLLPGVYPAGGPPVGWPSIFPSLTIDLDGTPEFPESSATSASRTIDTTSGIVTETSSESSASCTNSATVTDVTVYITVVTDASTTTSSTISSAAVTHTGCGLSGSTITSVASASCSTCCPDWSFPEDPCPLEDDPDREDCEFGTEVDVRVRALAGRVTMTLPSSTLERRTSTKVFNTLGACPLQTTITNLYPQVSDYATIAGPSSFYLVTFVSQPNNPSCLPEITKVAGFAGVSTSSGGSTYDTVGPSIVPRANSDHVYEVQILKKFFEAQLNGLSSAACQDFSSFLEDPNSQHLRNIWAYLPSLDHPDMAGMDNIVNDDKGKFYQNTGLLGFPQGLNPMTRKYARLGLAAQVQQHPDIISLFQRSHQRMYQAFLGIDSSIAAQAPTGQQATWACAYTDFVNSFVSNIAVTASSVADSALRQISILGGNTDELSRTFPPNIFAIPFAQMTALAPGLQATNVKRQACQAPLTAASSIEPTTTSAAPASSATSDGAVATATSISSDPLPTLSNTGTSFEVATATSLYITCIASIGSCIDATLTATYLSPGTPSFITPSPSSAPTFTGDSGPSDTLTEVTLTK